MCSGHIGLGQVRSLLRDHILKVSSTRQWFRRAFGWGISRSHTSPNAIRRRQAGPVKTLRAGGVVYFEHANPLLRACGVQHLWLERPLDLTQFCPVARTDRTILVVDDSVEDVNLIRL